MLERFMQRYIFHDVVCCGVIRAHPDVAGLGRGKLDCDLCVFRIKRHVRQMAFDRQAKPASAVKDRCSLICSTLSPRSRPLPFFPPPSPPLPSSPPLAPGEVDGTTVQC